MDGYERLWSDCCAGFWQGKAYVPASLRELARGRAALDALEEQRLLALRGAKVSELKVSAKLCMLLRTASPNVKERVAIGFGWYTGGVYALTRVVDSQMKIREMRLRVNPGELVEKADFVAAILTGQRQRANDGSPSQKLLRAPRLRVRRGECLPKAALRLSLADAQRTSIEPEELTGTVFNIRTRADGALAQVGQVYPSARSRSRHFIHSRHVYCLDLALALAPLGTSGGAVRPVVAGQGRRRGALHLERRTDLCVAQRPERRR